MKRREFVRWGIGSAVGLSVSGAPAHEASQVPVIDAHCHAGRGMNYGRSGSDPWTDYNDPEWTLQRMAEAGIDRTILFPINNTSYREANIEIAGYVRRWPSKFIGFAKHDQVREAGKIRDMLRHEVHDLGLRGLKLHGQPSPEMVEAAAELRIPILVHPDTVGDLEPIVKANPQVSFILAHLGSFASGSWREHVRAIEAARTLQNLYLDTSSVVFVRYLEQAARDLPPTKLIFGSDGPLVDARVELHKVRLLRLPAEAEALVLSGNIRRLLSM
jgi:uncharacterized protein